MTNSGTLHHPYRNCSSQLDRSLNTDICPGPLTQLLQGALLMLTVDTSLPRGQPIENPANHSSGVGPSKHMDFIQLILSSHLWNHN